jgi:hypothetical protein
MDRVTTMPSIVGRAAQRVPVVSKVILGAIEEFRLEQGLEHTTTRSVVFTGSVSPAEKARRRAHNKRARQARAMHRRAAR